MTSESRSLEQQPPKPRVVYRQGASEAVYGLGMLGAWFYYLGHATTVWAGLIGLFKGIFWPAFLVYEALRALGM